MQQCIAWSNLDGYNKVAASVQAQLSLAVSFFPFHRQLKLHKVQI